MSYFRFRLTVASARVVRIVVVDDGEWVLLGRVEGRPVWWCSGRLYDGATWFDWLWWGEWVRFDDDDGPVFVACTDALTWWGEWVRFDDVGPAQMP